MSLSLTSPPVGYVREQLFTPVLKEESKVKSSYSCCNGNTVTQVVLAILGLLALGLTAVVIAGFAGALPFTAIPLIGISLATASPLVLLCTAVGGVIVAGASFLGISSVSHAKDVEQLHSDINQLQHQAQLQIVEARYGNSQG